LRRSSYHYVNLNCEGMVVNKLYEKFQGQWFLWKHDSGYLYKIFLTVCALEK